MNGLIPVEFDGKVFVPLGPVSLPVGAKCGVEVSPIARSNASAPLPPLTPEEEREWEEILAEARRKPPFPATFEEYLRFQRGGEE